MPKALVFNGSNALDFQDIRANVIRIPEVIHTIREAQNIWDALNPLSFDLVNFIGSDDATFLHQIKLKNFAAAVVQVGLLRRYLRTQPMPDFMIGSVNGDSPLRVALQQISFVELVAESEALPKEKDRLAIVSDGSPLLAGVRLEEYAVFEKKDDEKYKRVKLETYDVQKMVENLIHTRGLDELVFVGPGSWGRVPTQVRVSESIGADGELGWFWSQGKEAKTLAAVAN